VVVEFSPGTVKGKAKTWLDTYEKTITFPFTGTQKVSFSFPCKASARETFPNLKIQGKAILPYPGELLSAKLREWLRDDIRLERRPV
jgi:hypothetical protein